MNSPDAEDRDDYLLLPLHKLRDYGKKVEQPLIYNVEEDPESQSPTAKRDKVAGE